MEQLPKKENIIIKEGVDFVFEQNPKLAQIGTKEQYSKYIDTIFPNSKLKDIVYHGTSVDSYNKILKENFDLNKSGDNLGYLGRIASFFLERGYTNNFTKGAVVSALVNITSKYIDNSGNLNEEGINILKQKLLEKLPFFYSMEYLNKRIDLSNEYKSGREIIKIQNFMHGYFKNHHDVYNSILLSLGINGLKRSDIIVDMLSTDQIHVLGSNQDLENFKKFVEKY